MNFMKKQTAEIQKSSYISVTASFSVGAEGVLLVRQTL